MSAVPIWDAGLGVPAAFLARRGGVSQGVYASLNVGLGSDDDQGLVRENRRRAADAVLPGAPLVTTYQVHSAACVTVAAPWGDDDRPRADALVTTLQGVTLGVLTADCTPVLFADVGAGVIGAAHAGWRGAFDGVTDATVAAMEALGARRDRIAAVIGPTIAQSSYEVDAAFRARFLDQDAANIAFFAAAREGHAMFDLPAYVAHRLRAAGVGTVRDLALDTYAREADFFSFRRSTHRGEAHCGRQIAVIAR